MNEEADKLERLINEFMRKSHCLYQVDSIFKIIIYIDRRKTHFSIDRERKGDLFIISTSKRYIIIILCYYYRTT